MQNGFIKSAVELGAVMYLGAAFLSAGALAIGMAFNILGKVEGKAHGR